MKTQITWDCKSSTAAWIIDIVHSAKLDVWFIGRDAIIKSQKRTVIVEPGDQVVLNDNGQIDVVEKRCEL